MEEEFNKDNKIRIKVIGVGGGGNNAVTRMIADNVKNVEYYLVNTETGILKRANTRNIVQIGKQTTRGLGAGSDPVVGENSAIESKEELRSIIKGADIIFLTAGMGGGTGTGALPIVAEIAREENILTIAIVTKPFTFEGKRRMIKAEGGIDRIKNTVDALIIISNDKLLKTVSDKTTLNSAFAMVDDILKQGIQGVTSLITTVGEVNVDFADVKAILEYKGQAYMGIGTASGDDKVIQATKLAIENPLTDTKIDGARGVIFNVTGGDTLALNEINDAIRLVTDKIENDANIIFGTVIDKDLEDKVKVTVIATGIRNPDEEDEEVTDYSLFNKLNPTTLPDPEQEQQQQQQQRRFRFLN